MESYIPVKQADLYCRSTGKGQPVIILHGGPDFDHTYLLPELDRLANFCHLIYYDQRGRGRSSEGVLPEDVSIASEVEDLEQVRQHFHLERTALLGHSWGCLLALEYARNYPETISNLILMNPAPVSFAGYQLLRSERAQREPEIINRLKAMRKTPKYQQGDIQSDLAYYRIHFSSTLRQPELREKLVARLRQNFTCEGILKAHQIENRLYAETWGLENYDLLPEVRQLNIPTPVVYGERDYGPAGYCAGDCKCRSR